MESNGPARALVLRLRTRRWGWAGSFLTWGLWEMGFDLVVRWEDAVILRRAAHRVSFPRARRSLERAGAELAGQKFIYSTVLCIFRNTLYAYNFCQLPVAVELVRLEMGRR